MLTEDYCDFKIAKLLKEKGFKGDGEHFYEDNKITNYINYWFRITPEERYEAIEAPTIQMAMKWLRELGYLIIITIIRDGNDSQCLSYNIYKMNKEDKELEIIFNNYFPEFSIDSYKETIEAAIKYVLENLI